MTSYRFYIDGVEVEEPVSWDGEEFVISRSKEFFGFENSYSLSLRFWNKGAQKITEKYNLFGIEAKLTFSVEMSCDNKKTWRNIINGVLNCANYSRLNGEVSVMLEESEFGRTFKNRIETPVSLSLTESLDGNEISDLDYKEVTLQSKAIVRKTNFTTNTDASTQTYSSPRFDTGDDILIYFPMIPVLSDLVTPTEIAPLYEACADDSGAFNCSKKHIFENTYGFAIDVTINFRVKGYLAVNTNFFGVGGTIIKLDNTGMYFAYGNQLSPTQINISEGIVDGECLSSPTEEPYSTKVDDGDDEFDVSYGVSITLHAGDRIWLWYQMGTISPDSSSCSPSDEYSDSWFFNIDFDPISFIKLESVTLTDPTRAKVFMIHEALSKVAEIITGEKDCLKSEYFGARDSQPRQYGNIGCQRYISITNGINIRNMLQSNGTTFPINLSFKQLYRILDSVFCLGMNLEYDIAEARWFIRIEKREYFYVKSYEIELDNVANIEVKASLDNYFNGAVVGYPKWQLNNGQTNGIDEFNTKREYSILNKNAKKKLEISCEAIASGYNIEFTRRQQYLVDTTKDFETDNELYIICLNRVESNGYAVGTTNERDELFDLVENVISPETSYNLRISPSRNMYRWLRYVKCSLARKPNKQIKFLTGEGNYLLRTTTTQNECDPVCEINEKDNFDATNNCFDEAGIELINPEIITFDYPLNFGIFAQIMNNIETPIRVNCSTDVIYRAFIESVNFKPNGKEGGTAKFVLTTAPSSGAAFDSGYDEGYDIVL